MKSAADPYGTSQRQSFLWLAVGFTLLAALLGFGFGFGLFSLNREAPQAGLQKEANAPAAALMIPAKPPTPILEKEAEIVPLTPAEKARMPDDVRRWLEHLERIERLRKEMSHDQIGAVMVAMTKFSLGGGSAGLDALLRGDIDEATEQTPAQELQGDISAKRKAWRDLIADFNSLPPPDECRPIYVSYSTCLGETSAMILDVLDTVAGSGEDPQAAISALTKMRGTSSTIDQAGGKSDRGVQEVCDKYDVRKWFSISKDFGGGGLLDQAGSMLPIK